MKTQKILILGITGNLAKLKILPAIGQYFDLHKDEVNIEIYGYSRSKANLEEMQSLIRSQINSSQNLNLLPKITLVQGEYTDKTFYDQLVGSLTMDDSLAIYLAVPPSIYLNFLENSCPYSKRPIDILIEKPFGESLEEGSHILEIVEKCDLHQRVHFLDHYLFKSALQIDSSEVKQELQKYSLDFQNISMINICASETLDVKERGGYYDGNGAIKDMFPHLYSLYHMMVELVDQNNPDNTQWFVKKLEKSQYEGYKQDVNNPDSTTESYFYANLYNAPDQNWDKQLVLMSGKKQPKKDTSIYMSFKSGYNLQFKVAPNNSLRLYKANDLVKEFTINLDEKLDHTRVFENVFAGDFSRFVPNDQVLEYWEVYQKIAITSQNSILN
jgi:glucose-6-phosphate 1-dehydrogenase